MMIPFVSAMRIALPQIYVMSYLDAHNLLQEFHDAVEHAEAPRHCLSVCELRRAAVSDFMPILRVIDIEFVRQLAQMDHIARECARSPSEMASILLGGKVELALIPDREGC
jgi:hypothetical protein